MRIIAIAALAAVTLAVTFDASASAQSVSAPHQKVFGYQDAQTGEFFPLPHARPDTAVTPTTGKYEITFTVTVADLLPAGSTILCQAEIDEASQVDIVTNSGTTYSAISYKETGTSTVAAPKTAGSAVTCTVPVSYSWSIPPSSKSTTTPPYTKVLSAVSGSYTVAAYNAPSSSLSESLLQPVRGESSTLAIPGTVPTTAVTSAVVDVTL